MARKPDIQYVHQFYVYGSEAKAPDLKPVKKRRPRIILRMPKLRKDFLVHFDIASLCGIMVACVMMVLLTVGLQQLSTARQEYAQMERYVIQLQNSNVDLNKSYHEGFDPEDIREKAVALGMVPVESIQVKTIQVDLPQPQPEPEPSIWENISWYFTELFA